MFTLWEKIVNKLSRSRYPRDLHPPPLLRLPIPLFLSFTSLLPQPVLTYLTLTLPSFNLLYPCSLCLTLSTLPYPILSYARHPSPPYPVLLCLPCTTSTPLQPTAPHFTVPYPLPCLIPSPHYFIPPYPTVPYLTLLTLPLPFPHLTPSLPYPTRPLDF